MEKSKRILQQMVNDKNENDSDDVRFMNAAKQLSTCSLCVRPERMAGTVIVRDGRIIATGFNGAPKQIESCKDKGFCSRRKMGIPSGEKLEICFALHSTETALMNAAQEGISVDGAVLYTTRKPCIHCFKLLLCAGIKKVVYLNDNFSNDILDEIIKESKIEIVQIKI